MLSRSLHIHTTSYTQLRAHRQVSALIQIAMMARKCQIVKVVCIAMFLWQDVVYMKAGESWQLCCGLCDVAILTTVSGPAFNPRPHVRGNQASSLRTNRCRA